MSNASQPAKTLDEHGRCCGRKPLVYKRPTHRLFCFRCDREYTPEGKQRANWAWITSGDGTFVERRKPTEPQSWSEALDLGVGGTGVVQS